MIGGHNEHHGIRISFDQFQGRQRDGGGGISTFRFENEIVFQRLFPFTELDADGIGLSRICGDENSLGRCSVHDAAHGLLNQCLIADDAEQLFGKQMAAEGPESRSTAARHNDWINRRSVFHRGFSSLDPTCASRIKSTTSRTAPSPPFFRQIWSTMSM